MQQNFRPKLLPLKAENDLKKLVENRSTYALQHYGLNVFETIQRSEKGKLVFDDMVFTTMLRGKMIIHRFGSAQFDFLPHESAIIPDHEEVLIGFPEADNHHPAHCIAFADNEDNVE